MQYFSSILSRGQIRRRDKRVYSHMMGRKISLLLCLLALLPSVAAKTKVIELTPDNFQSQVEKSDALWAVEFYAPWCGHCKALAPEWDKFAAAVSPAIKVGALDADKFKEFAGMHGVQGFPTIKFFGTNKKSPSVYQGQRTAPAIAQHALQMLAEQVQAALGVKPSGGSSGSSDGSKGGKEHVVHLTQSDFSAKVLDSSDEWLVAFIAPWCGHCKKLHPEWEDAAKQLVGEYKLGMVDATVEQGLAQQYGVKGYPTIKHFKMEGGKKKTAEYQGGRTASEIVNYVNARLEQLGSTAPIAEITSDDVFKGECNEDRGGICVVAFLPHILDDQSAGRNARLDKLLEARKQAGRTFRFMWAQGGENGELEEKLGLGFGYPALVAMSPTKHKFAVMKGNFKSEEIVRFLNNVLRGKEAYLIEGVAQSTADIKPWPIKWRKVAPWDGKDAAPPVDEDVE